MNSCQCRGRLPRFRGNARPPVALPVAALYGEAFVKRLSKIASNITKMLLVSTFLLGFSAFAQEPLGPLFFQDSMLNVLRKCRAGDQRACAAYPQLSDECLMQCLRNGNADCGACTPHLPRREYSGANHSEYNGGRSGRADNESYARDQARKSAMYGCMETCVKTGCRYLSGLARDECWASEQRCKSNCQSR